MSVQLEGAPRSRSAGPPGQEGHPADDLPIDAESSPVGNSQHPGLRLSDKASSLGVTQGRGGIWLPSRPLLVHVFKRFRAWIPRRLRNSP